MRKINSIILSIIAVASISACNTEQDLELAPQNSYIKVLQGNGSDNPLKIEVLAEQELLVVSNSVGNTRAEIRVLKLNLNGSIVDEAYFPSEEIDEHWQASDALILSEDKIIIGGTIADSSLVFFSINSNLEEIVVQTYKNLDHTYSLTTLTYDEPTNSILFGGSEVLNDDEYTLYGRLDPDNLSIIETARTEKARALPSTAMFKDAQGGLNWAYNSGTTSTLVQSIDAELNAIGESELLDFQGATHVSTKKLIGSDMDIMLFGEVKFEGSNSPAQLFQYRAYSSSEIVFGAEGNNRLNGVKKIEDGYLVTGTTEIDEQGANSQNDFLLSKRGNSGSEIFTHSFGSDADEQLHDAVMINNRIFAIGSTIIGIDNSLLLLKLNEFGELKN